jgi:hypothetical protein
MSEKWLRDNPVPENVIFRERLAKDVEAFLRSGGKVTQVRNGASAWNEDDVKFMHRVLRAKGSKK